MWDSLWQVAPRVLASGNFTPWGATADEFDDMEGKEGYDGSREIVQLIRAEIEYQTLVRTSNPDNDRMRKLQECKAEAQKKFTTPARFEAGRAIYGAPFGPWYMQLNVPMQQLVNDFDLLSRQPVRYLNVTGFTSVEDMALLLRNERFYNLFTVRFHTGMIRDIYSVAEAVKAANLGWCRELGLVLNDRNRLIASNFMMAKGIARGTKLFMGSPLREVCTK